MDVAFNLSREFDLLIIFYGFIMVQSDLVLPSPAKGNVITNRKDISKAKKTEKNTDQDSSFEMVLAKTNNKKSPVMKGKKNNNGLEKIELKKENNLEENKRLLIQDSPLLSILTGVFNFNTGDINQANQSMITNTKNDFKQSVVEVIAENSLIQSIMDKGVNQVLSEEKLPTDILKEIGFDKYQETEIIDAFGIASDKPITTKQLLDRMGFDHELIQSELRILKDNVKMGDLSGYMVRSEKTQQKSLPNLVSSNLFNKGSGNIGQDNNLHQRSLIQGNKPEPLIESPYPKGEKAKNIESLGREYLISEISDIQQQEEEPSFFVPRINLDKEEDFSLSSLNKGQKETPSFIELTNNFSPKVPSGEKRSFDEILKTPKLESLGSQPFTEDSIKLTIDDLVKFSSKIQTKELAGLQTKSPNDIMQAAPLLKQQDDHSLIDKPLKGKKGNSTGSSFFLTPTQKESDVGSAINQMKTGKNMESVYDLTPNRDANPEQKAAKWVQANKNEFSATIVDNEKSAKVIHEPSQLSDVNMGVETSNFSSNRTGATIFQQDEVLLEGNRAENIKAMIDKIVEKAEYNIKSGGGAAKIQLKPDHLGKVIFNVDVNGKEVSLGVVTESREVQKMLEEGMGRLKESLHNQNLQFKSINVKIENESTSDNFARTNQGFDWNQEKEARSFIYEEKNDSVEKDKPRVQADIISRTRPEQQYKTVISRDRVSVRA